MPGGIPVATVAINGAKNAGILATQILGAGDSAWLDRIEQYKKDLEAMVMAKVAKMATDQQP
jgi:5-(carboxyamino)imidazole ribonucleotide mutase